MTNKFTLILRFVYDIITNFFTRKKIILITEPANWSINEDAKNIQRYLNSTINIKISLTPIGARYKIIHFMSAHTLLNKQKFFHISVTNKVILTWFHIIDSDKEKISQIPKLNTLVDYVHTACSITKNKLITYGLNKEKIIMIPLGINLNKFFPIAKSEKLALKNHLNLPTDKILIGSFQKDGNGWEHGNSPKLIKGPDIFCDAVEKISKQFPIHIILTGPARGYVKNRLEKADIPYTHKYLKKANTVAKYFKILDLYIIASREEGGPKALLEAMASGVPLISTKVGMTPDIIQNNINGFLVNNEDSGAIALIANTILNNNNLRNKITNQALKDISEFNTQRITHKFYSAIYKRLL